MGVMFVITHKETMQKLPTDYFWFYVNAIKNNFVNKNLMTTCF